MRRQDLNEMSGFVPRTHQWRVCDGRQAREQDYNGNCRGDTQTLDEYLDKLLLLSPA